jgi:hypothetical protein
MNCIRALYYTDYVKFVSDFRTFTDQMLIKTIEKDTVCTRVQMMQASTV